MSGGFNFGQASTGFSFGAPKPAVPGPGTGFGMTNAVPAATGGGFAFGTPTQATAATNPTGSFSFGTPAKSTAAVGGFSFGTPNASFGMGTPQPAAPQGLTLGTTAAPAAGPGFTLSGGFPPQTAAPAGGGFAFGTPQAQPQPAMQPPPPTATVTATTGAGGLSFGGFSFGATKVQATTPAAPVAAPGGGFSFGTGAPSNLTMSMQPQQPAPTAAVTASQGGGFAFGIKPSSTPAPPASTQAVHAPGPSLFASPISTTAAVAAAAAAATAAAVTAAAPGTGFTMGAAPTLAASTAAATTTAAGGGLAFMLKPLGAATITSTSVPTATVAAATTGVATAFTLGLKPSTGIAVTSTATTLSTTAAPPVMTYAQLEGLINKWSLELEDQERHFLQQATQVNAWDRMLVENGERITSLHKEMEKVKLDQRRLNQELDFILSQQKELEDLLCPLEESVKEQSGTIYMQNADEERERTYKLAENVDAQLKRMSQDLKEIIEHLNTSSGPADTSDPLQQICKILNTHMDSLQWIDQNSVLLQRRVEEVSKLCDNQRKEQEKTFRLTFD
ncbi:nucleoporin 62 like [Anarrhichthys ocellatus]|uniref:nucleoporin 62 like n=1 Tax=Anarrhichthys ocellatus TaxID=433405 RepID=UPI0012ED6B32|nr:nuclear pore glycoprotein p62 [Anarrhichthys ocellatus]